MLPSSWETLAMRAAKADGVPARAPSRSFHRLRPTTLAVASSCMCWIAASRDRQVSEVRFGSVRFVGRCLTADAAVRCRVDVRINGRFSRPGASVAAVEQCQG